MSQGLAEGPAFGVGKPGLRVRLFGGPLLFRGEVEVPLTPYQGLLLAVVYGHGARGVPRSRAARLLWDLELDGTARHRLGQLMYTLQERAGAAVVDRSGERLLPVGGVSCDFRVGSRPKVDAGAPAGEELLGLLPASLPTRALEEWVGGIRAAARRGGHPEAGPPGDADRRGAVLASLPPGGPPGSSRLIGRDAEMAAALAAVGAGRPRWRTVVLSGEPGIGKSRLLSEVGEALRRTGRTVTEVTCHEAERHVSFNLVGDLLGDPRLLDAAASLSQPWRTIVGATFPATLSNPEPSPSPAAEVATTAGPRRVFDALERLFARAAREEGLVFLVDDFHWTDPGSAAALGFLRRRLPSLDVSVVLTVPLDVTRVDHPASAFLRALDATHDSWITLEALSTSDMAALVEEVRPAALPDEELRELCSLSGGVPLFGIELATERALRGQVPGPFERTTTRGAEALFRRRQARLTPSAHHVLRVLAVLGRPVGREALRECARMEDLDLDRALDELTRERLAVRTSDGRVDSHHELVRGAVYRDLPDAALRRYHGMVADALLRAHPPPSAGELAIHFQRARVPELAHRYAMLAAEEASEKGAFLECRGMLEVAAAMAGDASHRFDSLERLGRLCLLQGQHALGATHLGRAAECALETGDVGEVASARLRALGALVEIGERHGDAALAELRALAAEALERGALSTYLEAIDLSIRVADYGYDAVAARAALTEVDRLDVRGEAPAVRCLRETIRTRHVCYGDPDQAVESARAALEIAEAHGLAEEFGRAVKRLLVVLGYRGLLDGEEGRRLIEEAKVVFRGTGDQSGLFDVLINFAVWLVDTGRYAAAEPYLAQAGGIVQNLEESPEHSVFTCNMGEYHLYQGDYLTAKRYFRRAWEGGGMNRRATRCAVGGGLALCCVQTGDLGIVEELDAALPSDLFLIGNPTIDPTPVALFRARRLEVRQSPEEAATLLRRYGEALKERIVPAWMKILLGELRIRRKYNLEGVIALADEGARTAASLGLEVRLREFESFL